MRKRLSVFFALIAVLAVLSGITIFGSSAKSTFKTYAVGDELIITSDSAYLTDVDGKTVMYTKNETAHRPIASMCKIMTLNICFDKIKEGLITLDDEVTVSKNASSMGGSQVFLGEGLKYKVSELMKSIAVASANDSSVAMAEYISGSQELFVEEMNKKANELGMNDTLFANCTGLPTANQYSCAKDVAIMTAELLKNPEYFNFSKIWTENFKHSDGRETLITNTNKLIRFYDGCDGGKTGFTNEAGFCISASAVRNGMRLISVVIHAPTSKERFKDASMLFNYGFNNYVSKTVIEKQPLNLRVTIENGVKSDIEVLPSDSLSFIVKRNEKFTVESDFKPIERVKAPVNKGDIVGTVTVYRNGSEIGSVQVLSNEDVKAKTYFDNIKDIIGNWAILN